MYLMFQAEEVIGSIDKDGAGEVSYNDFMVVLEQSIEISTYLNALRLTTCCVDGAIETKKPNVLMKDICIQFGYKVLFTDSFIGRTI